MYAFADAFDRTYMIKREFQNMLGKSIPFTMFTDSKSLFDVLTKCSITTEKRLMIDIKTVREAYDRQEVSDVGFLRSEFKAADTFTKVGHNKALANVLAQQRCAHPH